ncbi:Protein of unknown function [Bacillus mycoides]|nr:Protein of unknown function [Bacillus mycoides]
MVKAGGTFGEFDSKRNV